MKVFYWYLSQYMSAGKNFSQLSPKNILPLHVWLIVSLCAEFCWQFFLSAFWRYHSIVYWATCLLTVKSAIILITVPFIFFYFWLHWVFVAAHRLSLVVASGGYSLLQCVGFSLQWLLLLGSRALGAWASVVAARALSSCGTRALERAGFSSCSARAQ